MKNPALILIAAAWLAACATATPPPATMTAPIQPDASAALHQLFDDAWERRLRDYPVFASNLGDMRYADQWTDNSPAAIEARHQANLADLARLRAIDRDALSTDDRLNYDLFEMGLQRSIEAHPYRMFLMPIAHRGGLQSQHTMTNTLRLQSVEDFDAWLARLARLDVQVEQAIELMQLGIAEGRMPPRILMTRVPPQIAASIADDPEESPFFNAFRRFPASVPDAERARLEAAAREVIATVVTPAYRRLQAFFEEIYLPASRDSIGVHELPEGRDYYAQLARMFTTTELTPDEIHAIGLAEVARIRAHMLAIIDAVGFEGGFDAFLEHLRTDPKFYYETGEELLLAYQAMAKRIDPLMVQLFGKLPRMPYGVRPIPMAIAPDTTTAYYSRPAADGSRAGYHFVNIYRPEVRPKYEMMALSLHEGVPGHHLQIALAQELGELPDFRRYVGFTAFSEGWGLYAEYLGEELGLYEDPYDKFGQLTYEMWRAIRLVVDTGIHHLGWSRQQAIDYFMANAAKTEADIINEIDRYIGNPGQALAYKIGELKIKALRQRAEERLGAGFDVRAFHDTVLENGAVPLNILEQFVDAWLERIEAAEATP